MHEVLQLHAGSQKTYELDTFTSLRQVTFETRVIWQRSLLYVSQFAQHCFHVCDFSERTFIFEGNAVHLSGGSQYEADLFV